MDEFSFADVPAMENDDIFNMLFDESHLSPEQLNKSSSFQEDLPIDYAFLEDGFSSFDKYANPNENLLVDGLNALSAAPCGAPISPACDDLEPVDFNTSISREFEQLFAPFTGSPDEVSSEVTTATASPDQHCVDNMLDQEQMIAQVQRELIATLDTERLNSIESDHSYSASNSPSQNYEAEEDEVIVDIDDSILTVSTTNSAMSPASSYDYSAESTNSNASSPLGGATESMQIGDILEQCKSAMDAASKISDQDIEMPCEDDIYPQVHTETYTSAKEIRMNANDRAPMQYSHVSLTAEEKELLKKEGIVLPEDMPLTKQEDRALRCVRRKIRNKVSAKESRKRKQVYVDGLEKRIKNCTVKNIQLQRKVDILENSNVTLMSQLRKLQTLFTPKQVNKPAQTKTCLMVMLLSLALFAAPNVNQMNSANPGNQEISETSEQPQTNTGRSRNLLQTSPASTPAMDAMFDETEEDDGPSAAINNAINKVVTSASYSATSASDPKWTEVQALINDSTQVGRLLKQHEAKLRSNLEIPLNDLANETEAAMTAAADAYRQSQALSGEFVDDGMEESDTEELNIKIESALRSNQGDVFIDQTSLYDMLNTYEQNKPSVPARKRRRVVA